MPNQKKRRPTCGKNIRKGLALFATAGRYFLGYDGMLSPVCAVTKVEKRRFMAAVKYVEDLVKYLDEKRSTHETRP